MTISDKIIVSLSRAFSRNSARIPDGMKDSEWRYSLRCAADTIEWVIHTGRFSGIEVRALHDCRMYDLLRHLALTAIQDDRICEDHICQLLRDYKPFLRHYHLRLSC